MTAPQSAVTDGVDTRDGILMCQNHLDAHDATVGRGGVAGRG
jgi:hypothetical protein